MHDDDITIGTGESVSLSHLGAPPVKPLVPNKANVKKGGKAKDKNAGRGGKLKPLPTGLKAVPTASMNESKSAPTIEFFTKSKAPTLKSILGESDSLGMMNPVDMLKSLTKDMKVTKNPKQLEKLPGKGKSSNYTEDPMTGGSIKPHPSVNQGKLKLPDIDTYFQLSDDSEVYNGNSSIANDVIVEEVTDIGDRTDYTDLLIAGNTPLGSSTDQLETKDEHMKGPSGTVGATQTVPSSKNHHLAALLQAAEEAEPKPRPAVPKAVGGGKAGLKSKSKMPKSLKVESNSKKHEGLHKSSATQPAALAATDGVLKKGAAVDKRGIANEDGGVDDSGKKTKRRLRWEDDEILDQLDQLEYSAVDSVLQDSMVHADDVDYMGPDSSMRDQLVSNPEKVLLDMIRKMEQCPGESSVVQQTGAGSSTGKEIDSVAESVIPLGQSNRDDFMDRDHDDDGANLLALESALDKECLALQAKLSGIMK